VESTVRAVDSVELYSHVKDLFCRPFGYILTLSFGFSPYADLVSGRIVGNIKQRHFKECLHFGR
jgi:hypothetical protein